MAGERDPILSRLSHPRYLLFLAVMALSVLPLLSVAPAVEAVVTAFDLGVIAFTLSCVPLWCNGNATVMRQQAKRDDAGQIMLLVLTGVVTSVILAALGTLVLDNKSLKTGEIALLVVTLLSCWTFANLIYAFHYARLFYSSRDGGDSRGLDFPGDCVPDFSDFVNFAFVIGMTCQTADIEITDSSMRRVSTFHGLFAFAFNLGILALTVNVLASSTGG
ncbi:putative membrane protein [Novosphingobium sp. PhB165]|uniref:DUF1345 domain-containing protein n=1 Tax=Novosphingobium sp. PhB165 TaxID=2485105 RepID=UPI0010E060EE|nr:DUF1345 domain-containing protein [Novosphingobium sp. PhB165]TCM21961.1 putative membrane protein [Novosphingobium sp. PhB165]